MGAQRPQARQPRSPTTTTHATDDVGVVEDHRSGLDPVTSSSDWPSDEVETSYDHSSLDTDTGPPCGCGRSVPWCPCEKAGLLTHAWKDFLVAPAGDDEPRRAIVGRLQQLEALEAFLVVDGAGARGEARASSSPESAGTVMALILMTVTQT